MTSLSTNGAPLHVRAVTGVMVSHAADSACHNDLLNFDRGLRNGQLAVDFRNDPSEIASFERRRKTTFATMHREKLEVTQGNFAGGADALS